MEDHQFAEMEQSPLQLDEEYDKLPKLCSCPIFKRILLKLTTESTYMFNS